MMLGGLSSLRLLRQPEVAGEFGLPEMLRRMPGHDDEDVSAWQFLTPRVRRGSVQFGCG